MGSLILALMVRRMRVSTAADAAIETCALAVAHLLPVVTRRALNSIEEVCQISGSIRYNSGVSAFHCTYNKAP